MPASFHSSPLSPSSPSGGSEPLPEIARTEVRPGAARLFVTAVFLSLLLVPLCQHVLPLGGSWGPRAGPFGDFVAAVSSMGAETDTETVATGASEVTGRGRFFRANRTLKQHMDYLERDLERASRVKEQAHPVAQWLLFAYGGIGNERVYAGKDGWLYLRGGFDYLTGPPFLDPSVLRRRRLDAPAWRPAPEPDPRPAILDFVQQLEERGMHLLILPAPTKPMVHPEPLGASPAPAGEDLHNPSFGAFRAELEAAGVTVFDPALAMVRARLQTGRDQFLRADSHWSPEGLDTVAGALAERIRHLALFPERVSPAGVTHFTARPGPWRRQARQVSGVGDLERVLLLPPWQQLSEPQVVETRRVVSISGKPWRRDPRAEILLLGDSFTNVYAQHTPDVSWGGSAGLAEQLSYFLQRPVDRLAINAGGASGSRQRLAEELASGRDRLAGKKLVVFQFAVRDLAIGDWRVVELAAGH